MQYRIYVNKLSHETVKLMSTKNICFIFSIFLLLGTACSSKKSSSKESSPQAQAPAQAKSAVQADDETYTVNLPTDGGPLVIKAKAGYKINADFPHRAIFSSADIKEEAKTDRSDKKLSFAKVSESKLPAQGVKAEASFSVCNDQMCKLYKETYQW